MPDKDRLANLKFKSIEELKPFYDSLALSRCNPRDLTKKLGMIFQNADDQRKMGDIENAYIAIMKYLNVFSYIQKTSDYKKDPVYYKMMMGKQPKEAVAIAEELHSILTESYSLISGKESNKIKVPEKTPAEILDMRVKKESKLSLTSAELFSMLKDGVTNVLIMDIRSSTDFENSRITENMVNIPNEILEKGKSAHTLEQILPEESKGLWKKRGFYDQIILLDWMTNEQTFQSSKLFILKEILTEWDVNTKYKNEILILEGGYDDWLNSYPWYTTNPKPPRPHVEEITSDIILDQIIYPELDDLNTNVNQEFLKPFFDRSKKPTLNESDVMGKNHLIDSGFDQSGRPNIDRSKKAAAIRTYEERKADMKNLLNQKEIETSEAIDLEKSVIDSERELQDTILMQKEIGADDDKKRELEEKQEKLLIKLEELKEELIVKDNKIKELQKKIEEDEEEMAKKQEDLDWLIREAETNKRIRMQEEERKRLEKEREEVERLRDEERKRLEEKHREQLEIARRKKKLQNENNTINSLDNNYYNKVPTINRANKPRLEEKIRQFSGVKGNVGIGLTGLKNLGNTCYMNSIIQCISNNSTLAKYFCENLYLDDINRSSKTKGEVAGELAAVIKTLWSGKFRSIACRDLKNTIGQYKSEYATYEQQDSHEFLTFLMDWLHGDLNQLFNPPVVNKKGMNEAEKAWLDFKRKNESLISTLFYGIQRSTVSCLECGESSVTYEPFSNLSLIIPDLESCTIVECLKLYMKSERISGWKCPKCQECREAEKKTDVCKLPPILVVHLKRFHYIDVLSRKRTTYVDFPLSDLNMAQFAVNNEHKRMNYNLYAVSNHYGTMEGGHYTAYCKSAIYKKWYKFDDHEVFEISPSDVKTSAAYILFYTSLS
ncbi:UNVERIFIED_CONTAM: hypothetical protein PYX00_006961 [Menopon gallinae]|uniref:Ubiquitin carboxyl-terminal hydrolase n=1 Tax=Menopon gallinae TaxID=328185 RepID=A0AAW2HHI8_9NEOP